MLKEKSLHFALKMPYWGIFGLNIWKGKCHVWNQQSPIFQNVNFLAKQNNFRYRTKNTLLWHSYSGIWKKGFHISIQKFNFFRKLKFWTKTKKLQNCGKKCRIWEFFGLPFWKTFMVFEITTLELDILQKLLRHKNVSNMEQKNLSLSSNFWKSIIILSNMEFVKMQSFLDNKNP